VSVPSEPKQPPVVGDTIKVLDATLVCGISAGKKGMHRETLAIAKLDPTGAVVGTIGGFRMRRNGEPCVLAQCPKHGWLGVEEATLKAEFRSRSDRGRIGKGHPLVVPMTIRIPFPFGRGLRPYTA
jgi:hypothetical protein